MIYWPTELVFTPRQVQCEFHISCVVVVNPYINWYHSEVQKKKYHCMCNWQYTWIIIFLWKSNSSLDGPPMFRKRDVRWLWWRHQHTTSFDDKRCKMKMSRKKYTHCSHNERLHFSSQPKSSYFPRDSSQSSSRLFNPLSHFC